MDIVFLDTETTSLHPETGEIWEFAGIRIEEETEKESVLQFFIEVDLAHADPFSLKIGKFYDRWPKKSPYFDELADSLSSPFIRTRNQAAAAIEAFTRGATIVVNVPTFDEPRLDRLLRSEGLLPSWHYHVLDMESIIVGYAAARGDKFPLPYSSTELTKYLNVEEPTEEERHTAMGDARWVQRQWEEMFAF